MSMILRLILILCFTQCLMAEPKTNDARLKESVKRYCEMKEKPAFIKRMCDPIQKR